MPIAHTNTGPGSLATFIGSEPGFEPSTVWFHSCWENIADPENLPPLKLDENNKWFQLTIDLLRKMRVAAGGDFIVGCPDLVENIDILASLRDAETLLMDMIERPGWVSEKLFEINQVWFDAYDRIYDIIKLADGSSAFGAFHLWGPGKTAKVQCDAAAMFSPDMFRQFVVPALTEQCEWLDFSMFHLDGTQCICQLDALLEIEALDALEWTPQAGIERGGSPRWYDLYRRVLAAGKSVQALGVKMEELRPLLDAIGTAGVYIMPVIESQADIEELEKIRESCNG